MNALVPVTDTALPVHTNFEVRSLPHVFKTQAELFTFQEGVTLLEVITSCGYRPASFRHLAVWIGDVKIPREYWVRVRPKSGARVVIRVIPQGGKGGGKNPFAIILRIVVMALSIVVNSIPGLGQLLSIATMTIGSMLINQMFKPKAPKNRGLDQPERNEVFGITGTQNQATPYGVVPRVFGRVRIFPLLAAEPYTEIAGDDQYLRMLFDLGPGPLEVSEIKIGSTPIESYKDVEYQISDAATGYALPTLYNTDVNEESFSIRIKNSTGPTVVTSPPDADEIGLDIGYQSLVKYSDGGDAQTTDVQLSIEFRKSGETDWQFASFQDSEGATLENWNEQKYLEHNPDVDANWNTGTPRGWTHYQQVGKYEGRLGYFNGPLYVRHSGKSATPKRFGHKFRTPTRGQYDIRITRITSDRDEAKSNLANDSFLMQLRTFTNRPPVTLTGHTLIAVRIRAPNQLNGSIGTLNCIAQAKLETWTGTEFVTKATRNPAWAYLDVMRGPATKRKIPDHRINFDDIKAWADWCDELVNGEPRRTYDKSVDSRSTIHEMLREISLAGRAAFGERDGKFTVVRDLPQTTPVQVFTPRNSWDFRGSKTFVELPHALKARFINPDRDWKEDEAIYYNDGYDSTNATVFESIGPPGCTRYAQAYSDARYFFAAAKLRPEVFELSVDVENLICTRGDMVWVQHDVPSIGGRSARVKAVTVNGSSEVTSITLDDTVTMEAARSYSVRWRRSADNVKSSRAILTVAGEVNVVTPTLPIPASSAPAVGDLIVWGETNQEVMECVVKDIRREKDLAARLVLLPASPALHNMDEGPIPPYVVPSTREIDPTPLPVTDLAATESLINVGSSVMAILKLTWRNSLNTYSAGYEVFELVEDTWTSRGLTQVPEWTVGPMARGTSYEYAVVAISSTGKRLAVADSSSIFGQIIGNQVPPVDVDTLVHEVLFTGRHKLTWTYTSTRPNLAGFRVKIRAGRVPDWHSGTLIHTGLLASSPFETDAIPNGTWTIMIKAVDTDGVESEEAVYVTIGSGEWEPAHITNFRDHRLEGFPDTKLGCSVVAGDLVADDPGTEMYAANTAAFYTSNDADAMWPNNAAPVYSADETGMYTNDADPMYSIIYAYMSYRFSLLPENTGLLAIIIDADGAVAVSYRRYFTNPMYGTSDLEPMYTDDAALMYTETEDPFLVFNNGMAVSKQAYEIMIEIAAGPVQGKIRQLKVMVDAPTITEFFNDVAVPPVGIRIVPTQALQALSNVLLTVQNDGGSAVSARVVDKDPVLGVLVECVDIFEVPVSGTVDVQISGY